MNNFYYKLIRYSGMPFIFRELIQRRKITILLFHDITVENASYAFPYLKKHYHIIGLQDYLNAVRTGNRLPKKAVIITFDDGHKGNYKLLPIIKQLQIPITIFLCSDIVGTNRHFWFTHSKELRPEIQRLKKVPNHVRLETLQKYGYNETQEYADRQALSKDEIEEMRPWVDFQSHTCFHPVLTQCDDATAQKEIALSKQHLERDFSFNINTISYPNGDYSLRDIQFSKEAGYSCGITVEFGYNNLKTDLFRLKRNSVNEARTVDELIVKASGCYGIAKRFICKFLNKKSIK